MSVLDDISVSCLRRKYKLLSWLLQIIPPVMVEGETNWHSMKSEKHQMLTETIEIVETVLSIFVDIMRIRE